MLRKVNARNLHQSLRMNTVVSRLVAVLFLAALVLAVSAPLVAMVNPPQIPSVTLAPVVNSVAGNTSPDYGGDGSAAIAAQLNYPGAVAVDYRGVVYVADVDNNVIRAVNTGLSPVMVLGVSIAPGNIATVAGNGVGGYTGDGIAISSQLNAPNGVALDGAGNLYIADTYNCIIRKVDLGGNMTTVVGNHSGCAYSGDGGPASAARLHQPAAVAVDSAGNLYISDQVNNRIRAVNMQSSTTSILGVSIDSGAIATVAGSGTAGYSGDYGLATSARLKLPDGIALDLAGNLFIADRNNHVIRRVDASSFQITTIAGVGGQPGDSGDGGLATMAYLDHPQGVAVDGAGRVYIADAGNNVIRVVDSYYINTLAGDGSYSFGGDGAPAVWGQLASPVAVAIGPGHILYVSDQDNSVIRSISSPWSPAGFAPTNVGSSAAQNVYLSINTGLALATVTAPASQGGLQEYAVGSSPDCTFDGVTQIAAGTICTVPVTFQPAYAGLRQVPLVLTTGTSSTIQLGLSGTGVGPQLALLPGTINTVAGTPTVPGYDGDSGAATSAHLTNPHGVAVDAAGNFYIADSGNNVVRRVDATTQAITTAVGSLNWPLGVALDAAGNLFIADANNHVIRKLDAATQAVTVVAGNGSSGYSGDGGTATNAQVGTPFGVTTDAPGNLYIVDQSSSVIRKVDAATQVITTVAGSTPGYGGDSGPATSAQLNSPKWVAVDAAGNIFIADTGNRIIRRVDALTQIITTVAGTPGSTGYSGDGGPATSAVLGSPETVAVDAAGNLYIPDTSNQIVRKVDAVTGNINTIAGSAGAAGSAGDGGAATSAMFNTPAGVSLDGMGNLYVSDYLNHTIRTVTATAAPVSFPNTPQGTNSAELTVTASNIGNGPVPLALTSEATANVNFFVANSSSCVQAGLSLAPGAACATNLYFAPSVPGALTDLLTITDNNLNVTGTQQQVALRGYGTGLPYLSTNTLAFNSRGVGVSTTMTVTLYNITGASFTPSVTLAPGVFTVSGCEKPVSNAGSCTMSVTYLPTDLVSSTATLNVLANGTSLPVALSGTGVQQLYLGRSAINFGQEGVGVPSAAQPVTLFNFTGHAINPSVSVPAGVFAVSTDGCSGSPLPDTQSCIIWVTFTPGTTGPASASLSVVTGITDFTLPLSGTGVPQASLGFNSLAFGNEGIGVPSASQTVMVYNYSGSAQPLTINSGSSVFLVGAGTCGSSLPNNSGCYFTVSFAPTDLARIIHEVGRREKPVVLQTCCLDSG